MSDLQRRWDTAGLWRPNDKLGSMRLITLRAWLLVFTSAGLQIFMFPTGGPMPLWRARICWFALVPFLYALSLPGKDGQALSVRNSAVLGYVCGILWYFGNCFWIYQTMYLYGGMPKPLSLLIVVLFSLYLGLYHALFGALFGLVRSKRLGLKWALGLTPFLWVAVELARGQITGFPWDLLGYTQVSNALVNTIAPIAGVMGISFLIALVNAAFVPVLLKRAKICVSLAGVALLVAIVLQLDPWPFHRYEDINHPGHFATLLQENLSVGVAGRELAPESLQDELQSFTELSRAPKASFPDMTLPGKVDVIVWPEAPSHLQSTDPYLRSKLGELARQQNAPVIAGSLGVDAAPESERGYHLYDSATLIGADGTYSGRYDKIHLVPWGEYIPYKPIFGFVRKLTEGLGNMDRGTNRNVFQTGGHGYGIFVCYESIFGDEVREFANNGAEVLVNISDDGWYGETGAPWQHLNMARMRAIENNRWVLRSTNTGVTTAIDPHGNLWDEAPRHIRAAYLARFGFVSATTFYTRHGDWLAWLCVLVSAGGIILAGARELRPR